MPLGQNQHDAIAVGGAHYSPRSVAAGPPAEKLKLNALTVRPGGFEAADRDRAALSCAVQAAHNDAACAD